MNLQEFKTGAAAIAGVFAIMLAGSPIGMAQDHQHHHDHDAVPEMGADGKRLDSYQVKHDMDAETMAALREKIALYRGHDGSGTEHEHVGDGPEL